MRFLIAIVGVLQILGGLGVYLGAKSAIHEILAATSLGMGVLTIALTAILVKLSNLNAAATEQNQHLATSNQLQQRIAAAFDRIVQDPTTQPARGSEVDPKRSQNSREYTYKSGTGPWIRGE